MENSLLPRLQSRLERIYGRVMDAYALQIAERIAKHQAESSLDASSEPSRDAAASSIAASSNAATSSASALSFGNSSSANSSTWSQRDVVLIAYGDQITTPGENPLETFRRWLLEHHVDELVSTVHLLPFFPYSSDDGFSVIDFRRVDPKLGDWQDLDRLGQSFGLMFDLVLNHISQHSEWFQGYLRGELPWSECFLEVDPATDLSAVTRPRSLPLLTPVETTRGTRHVWTTFSADQIDLNYGCPALLVEMLDVLLLYASHGARIIRLDAIAYLWKQIGTSCVHLPQTHEVVKLMRDVLAAAYPGTLLLTETNVPHAENISYFGEGDEAHMVYQFSLPPLLLDAMLHADGRVIGDWLRTLSEPPAGATYFNFTASHDGIGVRPLEGLVDAQRLDRLVAWAMERGGRVSMRRNLDGSESPYELNVSYVSAMSGMDDPGAGVSRGQTFLASQAVMLALRGTPGVYFHSLVGTENDQQGVERSGQPRRINRRKFLRSEIDQVVSQQDTLQARIYAGYRRLLRLRRQQAAFHPDGAQEVMDPGDDRLLAFVRTAPDGSEVVLVVVNFGREPVEMKLPASHRWSRELIGEEDVVGRTMIQVAPRTTVWIHADLT